MQNDQQDVLHNITIKNCLIAGNVGGGIVVSYSGLTSQTPLPLNITFTGCHLPGDAGGAAFRMYWSAHGNATSGHPLGSVTFENGFILNSVDAAIRIYGQASAAFKLADTLIANPGRSAGYIAERLAPVLVTVACTNPCCGGEAPCGQGEITIRNVTIFDTHSRPFFTASNTSCGIGATFQVHNPNGCQQQLGSKAAQRHVKASFNCTAGRAVLAAAAKTDDNETDTSHIQIMPEMYGQLPCSTY